MYQPPHFREDRLEVQHALIRTHPLGLLISAGPEGIVANPLPFLLDPARSTLGTLRAHLARANPQWRTLSGQSVLVVFQGVDTYVTPSWYETKRQTGKVVPTWNYAIVQAHCRVRIIDEQGWLAEQTQDLTERHEGHRAKPWSVDDAPKAFIDAQLKGIVGLEIEIAEIDGKWKVSQNRPAADRAGVMQGLRDEADTEQKASAMAHLVQEFGTARE